MVSDVMGWQQDQYGYRILFQPVPSLRRGLSSITEPWPEAPLYWLMDSECWDPVVRQLFTHFVFVFFLNHCVKKGKGYGGVLLQDTILVENVALIPKSYDLV